VKVWMSADDLVLGAMQEADRIAKGQMRTDGLVPFPTDDDEGFDYTDRQARKASVHGREDLVLIVALQRNILASIIYTRRIVWLGIALFVLRWLSS
jgi:hypothetical protein